MAVRSRSPLVSSLASGALAILVLLVAACGADAAGDEPRPGEAVCRDFYALVLESGNRPMTDVAMRERARAIEAQAVAAAAPAVTSSAREFSRAIAAGDDYATITALQQLSTACNQVLTGS